jgi:ubiquinone/menaquinone biosynthesis C-methylase UbiE
MKSGTTLQDRSPGITEESEGVDIAALFNQMAEEYDDVSDLWYSWLFSRLHCLLAEVLARSGRRPPLECLDVGCGTGLQTNLLALFGHKAIGVDIAYALVHKARSKKLDRFMCHDLFTSGFPFVSKYSKRIRRLAAASRGESPGGRTFYEVGTAICLPFQRGSFDIVSCCGSTLNFIANYRLALAEMSRVLRSGGMLLLEVENRYNMDLFWSVIDGVMHGRLGLHRSWRSALRNLLTRRSVSIVIDYPFELHSGTSVNMPLRLFSSSGLVADLESLGFRVHAIHSIHSFTNLVPSVLLHNPKPGKGLTRAAQTLMSLEAMMGSWPVIRRLGCSTVYVAYRA